MYGLVSSGSKTDGKTDVRVLGSQPGLSPHSPAVEEDPGKDVGIPRHQIVAESQEWCFHHPQTCHCHWHRPLTLAKGRKGKKNKRL